MRLSRYYRFRNDMILKEVCSRHLHRFGLENYITKSNYY